MGLPPCSSFWSLCQHASVMPLQRTTYRNRTAHLQCLAHEELRALAHHHGAGGLHSHGPRNLEHGGGIRLVAKNGECSSESGCWWFRHTNAGEAHGAACPENAERIVWWTKRNWGQPIATSRLAFRHHSACPPAIAAAPPSALHEPQSQSCLTTRTARSLSRSPSSSSLVSSAAGPMRMKLRTNLSLHSWYAAPSALRASLHRPSFFSATRWHLM